MINCPFCKSQVTEQDRFYKCSKCNFSVGKIILGRKTSISELQDLCSKGRTDILKGFISKANKPFEAALVLQGDKVQFEFPNQPASQPNYQGGNQILIRVHSSSPGAASLNIAGSVRYSANIDFGLVSSRMAECLALIAAVRFLNFHKIKGKIYISANNREFVEYALRETIPRQKEMRNLLNCLWQLLEPFEWELSYEKKQRKNLQGGTTSKVFPQGLFPWLHIEKTFLNNNIYIDDLLCPAVETQLLASIKASHKKDGKIIIPITAKSVFDAWEIAVKKG